MRRWEPWGAAALAVLRRDVLIFLSYRTQLINRVLSIFFTLALFHFLSRLVRVGSFQTPAAYFAFVVVGLVVLQVLQSSLELPGSARQELVAGTFERLLLSPVGPVAGVCMLLTFPILLALVVALLTLGLGVALFGLQLHWATVALAVPGFLLGAVAFAAIALFIVAGVLAFKQVPGTTFLLAGLSLVAGLYFPISFLPSWIQWASSVQPVTPAVRMLRHFLVGTGGTGIPWGDVGRLTGFAVVLFPIGVVLLRLAVAHGRRVGSITEY